MSGPQLLSLPGSFLTPPATLPVAIDYPAALALRQMALVQDELPKYLLAPEISALLHYVPDLHRKMLLATLWNTGARINEALALTRGDFSLAPPYPFVQLATLKQRTEKATRTAGRVPAGSQVHRLVPLSDTQYVSQLQMMVATLKIPLERRNKRTGRMEKARIWGITDRTVRTWLNEAVEAAAADGVTFSVPVMWAIATNAPTSWQKAVHVCHQTRCRTCWAGNIRAIVITRRKSPLTASCGCTTTAGMQD